ncbi:TrmB family transcriptional regulator [Parapusillimonas granuli]|uniref:TrmB family transcriptional regulator n=1 Tax=Parapusillimonas granuli TaxID=380911 RepID=A0A853G6J9_9BURK|nr:TrmB family transcriptional regulator [Parapusillimonas granuli]MBB5217000.1 sugar-specific transcriptional regulator TrmB [Parapusillimonas granuli]MEB2400670.1 TrmB family transcriptional regulator [Alcaligenaceae bacterium]NYT50236.1 TrmB family transcriptional regulator [Parapusillimonas granuli]
MFKQIATKNTSKKSTDASSPVNDLQRLGFSEYEACTYLSLLQGSPATAYEVSKHSGLPRANIYGALESLAKKRAVQPVSENPTRYVPVEPSALLGRIASDVGDLCERLQQTLETLEPKESPDVVWSIDGEEQIAAKVDELIDHALQHVWIKASTDVLRRHAPRLKKAAARGVKLIFVVFGEDTKFLRFGKGTKVYLHEGNGQRVGGADNLFTIAIDYRLALTANLGETLTGAYTTNPAIVRMAETLIRHDVYMAEMMAYLGKEIEERFGKGLIELRRSLFSPEQMSELTANLEKAKKAVNES